MSQSPRPLAMARSTKATPSASTIAELDPHPTRFPQIACDAAVAAFRAPPADLPWIEGAAGPGGRRPRRAPSSGPVAAPPLDVADPGRDRDVWMWLTGWGPVDGGGLLGLPHPSHRGFLLELCPELAPKGPAKNRMHLDVRLEPSDDADAVARKIGERGGREFHFAWGDLPWRHFADPSGNEFCVLPSH